jgi:hypothetical protein
MDSIWFLIACVGFFWVVLWSMRDFSKPTRQFWPFDTRWMERPPAAKPGRWQRAEPGRRRE